MFRNISLAFVFVMLLAPEASSQMAWNWQGSSDGWSAAGGCTVTSSDDFLTMSVTGNQPHIQSPTGLGLTADDFDSFTVSVRNHTTVGSFLLKWFDDSNALLGQATIPVETEMDGPQTYTVVLSDASGWSGSTIAKFRLRGPAGVARLWVMWIGTICPSMRCLWRCRVVRILRLATTILQPLKRTTAAFT